MRLPTHAATAPASPRVYGPSGLRRPARVAPAWLRRTPHPQARSEGRRLFTGCYAARASSTLSLAFDVCHTFFTRRHDTRGTRRATSVSPSKPVAPAINDTTLVISACPVERIGGCESRGWRGRAEARRQRGRRRGHGDRGARDRSMPRQRPRGSRAASPPAGPARLVPPRPARLTVDRPSPPSPPL